MVQPTFIRTSVFALFLLLWLSSPVFAGDMRPLIERKCSICHSTVINEFYVAGSSHATELGCRDCHLVHPQRGEAIEVDCANCHDPAEDEHLAIGRCRDCHQAHDPLALDFTRTEKPLKTLCLKCHDDPYAGPSAHAANLRCAECHTRHGALPECLDCHEGHSGGEPAEPCRSCHAAHNPAPAVAAEGLDASKCLICHTQLKAGFVKNETAHGQMGCDECHAAHGQKPDCLDCHDGHSEQMQSSDCSACHVPHAPLPPVFAEAVKPALCAACHEETVATFTAGGGQHRQNFSCVGCHAVHPPDAGAIPACADCHDKDEQPHFALDNCTGCHNPHQPELKDISQLSDARPVCASCHEDVAEQLDRFVSTHSEMDCTECHQRHGDAPSCLGCHEGHSAAMGADDCRSCHQPHAPLQVRFSGQPASLLCAACHQAQVREVAEDGAAHRDRLSCVACHQRHPAAGCTDCHAEHPQKGQGLPKSCFICHAPSAKPHYSVGDCQGCHPPHQPLNLKLKGRKALAPVCVTCHQQVGKQFAARPSGHSEQDCTACHSDHTKKRICRDCHEPHHESMRQADCLRCHGPHQPQVIRLRQADQIPRQQCGSCHAEELHKLAENGAGHEAAFSTCTVCHPEHLPYGKQTKLACNDCHARAKRRHFTLDDCAGCHDPHQPLVIDLSKQEQVRPVCVSCHSNQERLYQLYPNKHSAFDCGKCHVGKHGSKPQCLDCHDAHIPQLKQLDCLRCHPPHFPQRIKEKPLQVDKVCASCHQQMAEKMKTSGGAHKKKPCVSCHRAHPPSEENVMPRCSECHDQDDNRHFAAGGCTECHQGHQPLGHDLSAAKNARAACLPCHAEVGTEFAHLPGAHAEQDCNQCHKRHGEASRCTECHEPHSPAMAGDSCASCHQRHHAPQWVVIPATAKPAFCLPCHDAQVAALQGSTAKHKELACGSCHEGNHGDKRDCSACHEPPHDPGLHRKFPNCLKCHLDPHNLADWRGVTASEVNTEKPAEPAAEPAKSEDLK